MANELVVRSGIISKGGFTGPLTAVTTSYGVGVNDYFIEAENGTFNVTLPTAVGVTGKTYIIKKSGTGTTTVLTTGGQTIDGLTAQTLTNLASIQVTSDGSNWLIAGADGSSGTAGNAPVETPAASGSKDNPLTTKQLQDVGMPGEEVNSVVYQTDYAETETVTPLAGFIVNPLVLVNIPCVLDPVPVIEPAVNVTAPTESVYIPKANIAVEPLTVTAPVEIASLIPYVKLPAETVVRPV